MSAVPPGPEELEALHRTVESLRRENAALRSKIEAAQANADRYKALYDALPVSVYVVDRDGMIVGVNPFHLQKMGKGKTTLADYVGKRASDRPSIVAAGLSEAFSRVLQGIPFEANEVYFPNLSGGGEGWFSYRGVPLVAEGALMGAIFVSMDVTDYHRAKEELRRHVEKLEKTLSGFLPICVSCKRIRDEAGQWNRLETYLSERAEVEFTHGLCPECTRKLYPDLSG